MFSPELILYGVLFLGVLLLVEAVYMLMRDARGGPQAQINRRVRMIHGGMESKQVLHKLRREGGAGSFKSILPRLEKLLSHAGISMSLYRFLGIMVGIAAATFALLNFMPVITVLAAALISLFAGFVAPIFFLVQRKNARLRKFGEQLPEALDMIVRSLRAGHPINAALSNVAEEFSDPMGTEIGIAVDEMTFGLELQEALQNLAGRLPDQDLQYVVVTIEIQEHTGGNLAEVLSNLADTIRQRFAMKRKVRAVSAEGRLSAWVLTLLPFFVGGFLLVQQPNYYGPVLGDPLLPKMIGLGAVLLLIGIFVMWRMVNFRI